MNSTNTIVTAGRRLARSLLKNTGHCPEFEYVDIMTHKANCNTIASHEGFSIRIDALGRVPDNQLPEVLVARTFHAAAHMLCIQAGVSSHGKNGRHTKNFELALIELGGTEGFELNKSQQAAADAFAKAIRHRNIAPTDKPAYARGTIKCPAKGCRHQITLRKSAIARTRFLCVEHGEEMTA